MLKLNAKGFSHWIVPIAALVLVAGVGTYVLTKSKAASTGIANDGRVIMSACVAYKSINFKYRTVKGDYFTVKSVYRPDTNTWYKSSGNPTTFFQFATSQKNGNYGIKYTYLGGSYTLYKYVNVGNIARC